MKLTLSDDQRMIRDAAQEFLADCSDSGAVRACVESEQGFDAGVWQQIAGELGWCGVGQAEAAGGMGADPLAQVLMLEQMGYHLLCAPYFGSVCLAANVLDAVGDAAAGARILEDIVGGACIATVPLPAGSDWASSAASTLRAEADGDAWLLSGSVKQLPEGARADQLLLFAQLPQAPQTGLFAVAADSPGLVFSAQPGWDATRRFADATLDSVKAVRVDGNSKDMGEGMSRATARGRLFIAAEQLGGAQRCLDLTTAYVAERRQFGRSIASFQAVKHRCAQMMVHIESLRSAVYGAAAGLLQTSDTRAADYDCTMARILADEALFFCAQEAIQLHGGVGFTWEYDPQLYFKRAQASRHWLGTPDALREQVATMLLGTPAEAAA